MEIQQVRISLSFFEIHTLCLAIFHIGYAYLYGGWKLKIEQTQKGTNILTKGLERGDASIIALYAVFLSYVGNNKTLSNLWAQKALGK